MITLGSVSSFAVVEHLEKETLSLKEKRKIAKDAYYEIKQADPEFISDAKQAIRSFKKEIRNNKELKDQLVGASIMI